MSRRHPFFAALLTVASLAWAPASVTGQVADIQLRDRGGTGIPSSQFATFVEAGDFIFYPYYEYYRDKDAEYKPDELGYSGDTDHFGRYEGHEGLLFLGYGISSRMHVELEAAVITAKQERASDDTSDFPAEVDLSFSTSSLSLAGFAATVR